MPPSNDTIRRDLNRGASISFAGNIFKLVEFLLTLLAARLFGVQVWGQYIFLNTLLLPLQRLACAGLDKGLIWFISKHRDSRMPTGFFAWIRNRILIFGGEMALFSAGPGISRPLQESPP